jgi:signal transduction histidine kinase
MQAPRFIKMHRLRWRLVAAFVGFLVVVVAVFSWAAYRAARDGAVAAASSRLEAVSGQLGALLQGNITSFMTNTADVANDPTLRAFVRAPSTATRASAETLLDSLSTSDNVRAIEVREPDGGVLLTRGRAVREGSALPALTFESDANGPRVSGFATYQEGLGFGVSLPIQAPGQEPYTLVYHVGLNTSPEAVARVSDLIGGHSALYLGVPGGLWTNLVREVPGPDPELAPPGPARWHVNADGERVLGAGAPMTGTPWVVRVEFPEADVLATPRSLATRLAWIGVLTLMVGALLAWVFSHRITRRLSNLSAVATAIASGDYRRRVVTRGDDEITELGLNFNAMADKIEGAHERLERQVASRTAKLEAANQELEAFSYSVSHDLRAPLRAIHGFSRAVAENHGDSLPDSAASDLQRVCAAAERMGMLIDDLLELSRLARSEMHRQRVDLSEIAASVVADLHDPASGRDVEVKIQPDLGAHADRRLVGHVLGNLIENAWKFTSKQAQSLIEVGWAPAHEAFFVRDDGAGFDPEYVHKLFQPFQRLHAANEFEGTGIGLALVSRIIHRHGGRVWAEGAEGVGATFYFTLPDDVS